LRIACPLHPLPVCPLIVLNVGCLAESEEGRMAILVNKRERQLMAMAAAMLVLLLAGELYHHLSVKPVVLPRLLSELAELILLFGCTVAGTLLIFQVWVSQMAMATAVMVALLLVGDSYLSDKPASPWTILLELLKVFALLGCTVTCTLLVRRVGVPRKGHSR
jgi:hypothetical protein